MKKFKYKKATPAELQNDLELAKKMKFKGVKPSEPDERDFIASDVPVQITFPKEYISAVTDVFNQGSIGSCVAHSCATALAQSEEVQAKYHNIFSRGYIYGNRRDTDYQGEGMYIREALKNLNHCGDVLYNDFPYNFVYPRVKNLIKKDSTALSEKAAEHKVLEYSRCYTDSQIKNAIMTKGCVVICVPVYDNFGRDLHKPEEGKKASGYHAMVIVGWTKDGKWVVQNSWGDSWGYGGKLLMDKDYPIEELWGLTVDITAGKAEPKIGIFTKIINAILNFIKLIFKSEK